MLVESPSTHWCWFTVEGSGVDMFITLQWMEQINGKWA